MEYTYSAYRKLMKNLKDNDYNPIRFCDVSDDIEYPAIIRHDVDMDLQNAMKIAKLENEEGIKSTYFVLLTSEYYNLMAGANVKLAKEILAMGHEIGLHFDITAYDKDMSINEIEGALKKEISLLETILDIEVKSVSWHIPRTDLLGVHLEFLEEMNIWNAYDPIFYSGYKYVSDSMMRWREPIEEYIENRKFEKLQILTHPIWYRNEQNMTDEEILDENRNNKLIVIGEYLDTIKPGYFSGVSFLGEKISEVKEEVR